MIGSYTLLKAFEQCARQAQRRYITKDLPFEESDASRWGTRVHEAMEARLNGKPLPKEMQLHEAWFADLTGAKAEVKLGVRRDWSPCGFFDKDVWFRGKLDVLLLAPLMAIIIDWKTGKRREDPDELEIFAALLHAHHPRKRIIGWYVWLKDKAVGKLHDLSNTEAKTAEITERMARAEYAIRTNHFPPNETPLCDWCGLKTCEFNPRRSR